MTNSSALLRALIIYGICLPLAIFLGYLLTTPMTLPNLLLVGVLFMVMLAPLLLRWHHALALICWNMSIVVFFLPGSPPLWLVMALLSLGIAIMKRTVNRNASFVHVPAVIWPVVFLGLVILVTAFLTGGIGFRIFGSSTGGGKRYLIVLGAIIGYFALVSQPVSPKMFKTLAVLYFLGSLTTAVGYLVPFVPRSMYFLFYVFPVEKSGLEILGEEIVRGGEITRSYGFSVAAVGIYCAMLAAYGIKGVFSVRHWWRPILFAGAVVWSLYGGFRSSVALFVMIFAIQFWLEGLHRTKALLAGGLVGVLVAALLVTYVEKLPYSYQRSLSVLPVKVDPVVAYDAKASSEWRLQMWKITLPRIPKYFWLGKGYGLNTEEMAFLNDLQKSGKVSSMEVALMAGDYHNGPLSVIIPFGIFGLIGFLWLLGASLWVLVMNYRHSEPAFKTVNTFLLAYSVARVVFFFLVFGAFNSELPVFTGLVGLSICLNHGVKRFVPVLKPVTVPGTPQPARLFPVGWARLR